LVVVGFCFWFGVGKEGMASGVSLATRYEFLKARRAFLREPAGEFCG